MKKQLLFTLKLITFTTTYLFTRSRTKALKYKTIHQKQSLSNIAVFFILTNLKHLFLHHYKLLHNSINDIESLESDVSMFKAFLKDLAKKKFKNEEMKVFERQISEIVYDGDDLIDGFRICKDREKGLWETWIGGPIKMIGLANEVGLVRKRAVSAYERSRVIFRKVEEKKTSVMCLEREQNIDIRNVTEKSKETSRIDTRGYGMTSLKENSLVIQESDIDLPLAIGYVYFRSPIHVRVTPRSGMAPMAY